MQPAAAEVERETQASVIVQARPPSRGRASISRQSMPAARSRRPAAMPAAPPPMIAISVSLAVMQEFHVTNKEFRNIGGHASNVMLQSPDGN